MESPKNAKVKLYDREHCICNLIQDNDCQDVQLFSQAVQTYFPNKPNCLKLLNMESDSKLRKIRTYMKILS